MSQDEKERQREEFVSKRREQLRGRFGATFDPGPVLGLVRWTTPSNNSGAMVQCLRAAGWEAQLNDEGYEASAGSQEQTSALEVSALHCQEQYTLDPEYASLNESQLRLQYSYKVDFLVPCLKAHGQADVGQVPTVEVYLADSTKWDPYEPFIRRVHEGSPQYREMAKLCPRKIPAEYLYGE